MILSIEITDALIVDLTQVAIDRFSPMWGRLKDAIYEKGIIQWDMSLTI